VFDVSIAIVTDSSERSVLFGVVVVVACFDVLIVREATREQQRDIIHPSCWLVARISLTLKIGSTVSVEQHQGPTRTGLKINLRKNVLVLLFAC
jgi:hypothetical protein